MIVREVSDPRRFNIYTGILKAYRDTEGRRHLRGVASSTIVDRHGDEMKLSALQDMQRAIPGLTAFLNHSYSVPEDVLGTFTRGSITQRGEFYDLDTDLVVNEVNPRAVQTADAIELQGVKLGVSIGAMIPDGGAKPKDTKRGFYGPLDFEHVDLLEGSIVGIPANPRSWVEYAAKSFRKSLDGERVFQLVPQVQKGVLDEIDEDVVDLERESHGGQGSEAGKSAMVLIDADGDATIEKAPMSSKERTNLPDSAFACPSKRKYPHHTASGAVDKAHLRAALARCGDSSNDQCGCAHIRAHAKALGMGEEKSLDELLVFALETGIDEGHFRGDAVEGPTFPLDEAEALSPTDSDEPAVHEHPHAHVHTHEHRHWDGLVHSHEHAHVHAHPHGEDHEHRDDMDSPEHDHWHSEPAPDEDHAHSDGDETTVSLSGDALAAHLAAYSAEVEKAKIDIHIDTDTPPQDAPASTPESGTAGLQDETADGDDERLGDTLTNSVRGTLQLLERVTSELVEERRMRADADTKVAALQAENERLGEVTTQVLASTKDILTKIAATPMGRRTSMRIAHERFASLEAMYGAEFLNLAMKE